MIINLNTIGCSNISNGWNKIRIEMWKKGRESERKKCNRRKRRIWRRTRRIRTRKRTRKKNKKKKIISEEKGREDKSEIPMKEW